MRRARTLAILAVTVLLLSGCGDPEEPGQPEPPPSGQETPVDEEPGTPADDDDETSGDQPTGDQSADEHDDERVRAAAADLAEHTGTDRGQIKVVQFQAVTWPDGSIGCPEPGMSYTQALVDGYRLILEAGGEQYYYHAAGEDDFFLCADPQEPVADSQ